MSDRSIGAASHEGTVSTPTDDYQVDAPYLIHNYGLELPLYDADTRVAWTDVDLRESAGSGAERMVRRSVLTCLGSASLKQALELGRSTLEHTADALDVNLVDFNWGIYTGNCPESIRHTRFNSQLGQFHLPGYSLVADVQIIQGARYLHRPAETYVYDKSIDDYLESVMANVSPSHYLWDLHSDQLLAREVSGQSRPEYWLIDIEPRMVPATIQVR